MPEEFKSGRRGNESLSAPQELCRIRVIAEAREGGPISVSGAGRELSVGRIDRGEE